MTDFGEPNSRRNRSTRLLGQAPSGFSLHRVVFLPSLAFLFLAFPNLRTAQQRHADVAAHVEFLAAVGQPDFAAVDLAIVRIEDFAGDIFGRPSSGHSGLPSRLPAHS